LKSLYVGTLYILLILVCSSPIVAEPFDEEAWRRSVASQPVEKLYAPHYKDGKYFNPWMPMGEKKFSRFLKWRFSKAAPYTDEEKKFRAVAIPDLKKRIQALPADSDFIAWIGHATFLIRLRGAYWLTDPMFSDRALLPKRISPPAMPAEDLEALCPMNVLISHSHYDHLDVDSIKALPQGTRIFLPPGLKAYISTFFSGEAIEIDWWEDIDLGAGFKLVSLPTQHWSRRFGQPTNTTLWSSYLLVSPDVQIYFGGDSGYFIGYREFGRRFPNIDYALMPVTAYDPRWFMHYNHMNAPEALQAFDDLGARVFIPTQWGAFHLGDNPPRKPALDILKLRQARDLTPARYPLLSIGQIVTIQK